MPDDDITLARRTALAALGSVGTASVGAGLGTTAYFTDEESFGNTSLAARRLDIKLEPGPDRRQTGGRADVSCIRGLTQDPDDRRRISRHIIKQE